MPGIWSAGNSTSTTGPMTRTTRPVPSDVAASGVFSSVVVMACSLTPCGRLCQRVSAPDDLADFLGDLGLPGLVSLQRKLVQQVIGIVRRRLHGPAPGGDLGRRRVQQRVEDP